MMPMSPEEYNRRFPSWYNPTYQFSASRAYAMATKAEDCKNANSVMRLALGCSDEEAFGKEVAKGLPDKGESLITEAGQKVLPATDPKNKSAVCGKNCGMLDIFCHSGKIQAGCGGGGFAGLPATDPKNKSAVCGKNCGMLDIFCHSGKIQAGCGGGGFAGLPSWALYAVGAVVILIVIVLVSKFR